MPRKCCISNCRTGYDSKKDEATSNEKIAVYGFPSDKAECEMWIRVIPNVISNVSKYIGVCRKHWPLQMPTKAVKGGYIVPTTPPSIFHNIPSSVIPRPPPPPRVTVRTSADAGNAIQDEGKIEWEMFTGHISSKFNPSVLDILQKSH